MYTEFIIGYILMGVLALMLAVVIVLLCIILRKLSRGGGRPMETTFNPYPKNNAYSSSRGTVICRNCATQFDPAHTVCPKCGTPR